ncbi:MAG TPA: MgtC/SapB family protein [Anaerolineae bacterium]|nr:MgtC/SapB family protein [Anaerolineae bacterium]
MALDFYRFAVALGLGILIGIQREAVSKDPEERLFAGVRTFGLLSLVGYAAALASAQLTSALPFLATLLVYGALLALSYRRDVDEGKPGMTTEIASIATFFIGAMCYWNMIVLAAALAVTVTVTLSLKPQFRAFTHALTRNDIYATLKFAVISIIVLPVLPNQTFGPPPFDVLNPYKIWLMVVFISGISFLGYVMIKTIGARRGIGLTGLLGGIASSTAVTLSFAERSRENPKLARPFAFALLVAWTVMFVRVILVLFTLHSALAQQVLTPMLVAMAAGGVYGVYLFFSQRSYTQEDLKFVNPFELGPAIKFGLIYAVILVISKAAQVYFGDAGVYVSSFVSGLADVDAIALSMVDLTRSGGLDATVGARATVIAALANTLFKGGFALVSGSPTLRKSLWPGLALMVGAGILGLFLV